MSETTNEEIALRLTQLEADIRMVGRADVRYATAWALVAVLGTTVFLTLVIVIGANVRNNDRLRNDTARECVAAGGTWYAGTSCIVPGSGR